MGDDTYTGESYFTGQRYEEKQQAPVEYLKSNPSLARLEGGRWAEFSPWILLFVGIVPGVGLLLVAFSFPHNLRSVQLLRYGRVGYGRLVNKEATNLSVNEQTVYALTFKFTVESTGREHTVVAKTHKTDSLEDEELEPLLYLPNAPDRAVMFDHLPGSPTVDASGNLRGGSFVGALLYLVLPIMGALATYAVLNDLYLAFFG